MKQVLRADVAFFDQQATTGELLQGLNEDCVAISDAIGEKVGNFIHHLVTFVVGYGIGASVWGHCLFCLFWNLDPDYCSDILSKHMCR